MASRINLEDIRIDETQINTGRCFKMTEIKKNWTSDIIRWCVYDSVIEPIIAKGNVFDGVVAIY